jgi:hypothetical protein
MAAGVRVEWRNPDKAVHSALRLQEAVGERAFELNRGAFDACAFAILEIQFRDGPALFFSIHPVHAQQHFRPVLAFRAAGAGIDLHDSRQFVFGLVERAFEFGLFYERDGFGKSFTCFLFAGFTSFPELEKDGKVLYGCLYGFVELYPELIQLDIFQDFRSPFVVVPEAGAQRKLFLFIDLISSVIDVKETSSRPPNGPSYS